MADSEVKIKITTTADPSGSNAASKSLKELEQELKETRAQMRLVKTDSPDFAPLKDKVYALKDEIKQLGSAHDSAAGSGRNMGNALLQGSRAIDDLQYGLPGVVNNLEGIAMALGLGTGVAGAATVAAVAINTLWKNWDKLFGSVDAQKALWTMMTPDEESVARMEKFNRNLERQADLFERIGKARVASIEAAQSEADFMAKMAAPWKDLVPKNENDLPPVPGTEKASPELEKRQREAEIARENTALAVAKTHDADQAYQRQKKVVDDTEKRANLIGLKRLQDSTDQERLETLRGTGNEAAIQERAAIEKRLEIRNQKFQKDVQKLSGQEITKQLTGDPTKDDEVLKEAALRERGKLQQLEEARLAAAQAAQATYEPLSKAERAQDQQAALDQNQRVRSAYQPGDLPPAPGESPAFDAATGFIPGVQQAGQQTAEQMQQASQAIVQGLQPVQQAIVSMQQNLVSALSALAGKFVSVNSVLTDQENRIRQQEIAGRQ